ncbi:MAG: hypothetical protein KAI18_04600, partial [Candidatus Aenigmarchaeota archaeon]|nr:hypothetical protein [Candidatus Aenigmarchaeota archaeon]
MNNKMLFLVFALCVSVFSTVVFAVESSDYCMLDNYGPMGGETNDTIDLTYVLEIEVPNWTEKGCDWELDPEWDRPYMNMNTKWEMWMPPEECMMSGPEDFMDGDGKWLYSDSEGCFDIFEESECNAYKTTLSGDEPACEWFDEYMFTG